MVEWLYAFHACVTFLGFHPHVALWADAEVAWPNPDYIGCTMTLDSRCSRGYGWRRIHPDTFFERTEAKMPQLRGRFERVKTASGISAYPLPLFKLTEHRFCCSVCGHIALYSANGAL
jgi:hypothetical protein